MKGITHFVVGVAAASCFPAAVRAGLAGNPLYFVLGGCFGLLPDMIDFKFARYFYRHDAEVLPDPLNPDPQAIADAVAAAVNRSASGAGETRIKLNTVRVGADRWQRYTVRFDTAHRRVAAAIGPVVDTGQNTVDTGPGRRLEAFAPVRCDVKLDYLAETMIDIFDGPVFSMVRAEDGRVEARFIPWHRAWSHSLVVATAVAVAGAAIGNVLAGGVIWTAMAMHGAIDQLGHMGSALLYPFRKNRMPGLARMHSGEAMANVTAVWCGCLLILWNLSRASEHGAISWRALGLYGLLLPAAVIALYRRLCRLPPLRKVS